MRTIILAAGQGFELDGYNKLLIRDPATGQRIIDQYLRIFSKTSITVVVGFRAIEIMQEYPDLDYVYNSDWKITNNSYSLGLALNDEPCYVVSCDFFIAPEIIDLLGSAEPDGILTFNNENRQLTSLNCELLENNTIAEIYQGQIRTNDHPEAIGLYKISHKKILRDWKSKCIQHSNLFVGQNLSFNICPVYSVDKGNYRFDEVNTVMDYMRLLDKKRV